MHCKYGDADDFEGRTPCGTPRKSGKFALLQGATRQVGDFGRAIDSPYGDDVAVAVKVAALLFDNCLIDDFFTHGQR